MRKRAGLIYAAVTAAAAMVYLFGKAAGPIPQIHSPEKGKYYSVLRVVDGDTLKLDGLGSVRLIGVDTPEYHYSEKLLRDSRRTRRDIKAIQELGRKASGFTKALCGGKKVRLEFDIERHDKYKRILAYAYLGDGTFVNAKIIQEGYGQVMTIPPNVRNAAFFLRLEQEARESKRGLWGEGGL